MLADRLQHEQFEKAVELLIQSRRFKEALDLCMANSITITEELAERMTIAKTPSGQSSHTHT